VDVSGLDITLGWATFTFDNSVTLMAGQNYFLVFLGAGPLEQVLK